LTHLQSTICASIVAGEGKGKKSGTLALIAHEKIVRGKGELQPDLTLWRDAADETENWS